MLGSIYEFFIGATLPATTYGIYGSLWVSTGIYVLTTLHTEHEIHDALAHIRIPMAIFTSYALVASLFVSRASFAIFTTLETMLILFIAGYFSGSFALLKLGGYVGFVCSMCGFYTSAALLLEPFIDLPTGPPLLKPRRSHTMV